MSALTRKENGQTIHLSPWELKHEHIPTSNAVEFLFTRPGLDPKTSNPDHKLYIDSHDSSHYITVAQHRDLVGRITYILQNKYNLRVGDTVCLLLTNSIYLPALHLGILATGAAISPANIAYLPHELHHQLNVSQSKLIIGLEKFLPIARAATKDFSPVPIEDIFTFDSLLEEAKNPQTPKASPVKFVGDESKERHAYYCFSSGTSGVPKGVATSHFNVVSDVLQQHISARDALYLPNGVYGAVLPMSHIYGLTTFIYSVPTIAQSTIIVFDKFDFEFLLQKIQEHGVTFLHVVPPMAVLFAKSHVLDKYLDKVRLTLKGFLSGAAPLSQSLIDEIADRLKNGISITQSYGLTETTSINTFGSFKPGLDKYDAESCGWLMPGLEARLVDADGNDVHGIGPEHRGEVWLRGPNIMKSYLRNPKATVETFDHTGRWLRTGDVGIVTPDGQWYIVDRVKELIKSKGHQVAPAELESILLEHPDVIDAAVTGINLPEEGTELPRAYIVLSSKDIDPLAIKAWFDNKVSRHKQLWGGVVVLDSVPKSASGKIQRRLLRDRKNDTVYGYRTGASSKPKL
ncbi:uncharacterized protein SAPINGB_P000820 [Magnusiomyces paraingens]|uniref:AMP-dependent synthetase/ligase domain-containing protein n=1 Tax=Magnusiomyces paraingens TaxID=2606893 RepID=A0A5E8B7P9_9ASCO|nr:uncharacterized protein SAPINGB_P000820 [Saprochaete ingens]VVT45634.1 unnamed protein product [Saprochaete ingens]